MLLRVVGADREPVSNGTCAAHYRSPLAAVANAFIRFGKLDEAAFLAIVHRRRASIAQSCRGTAEEAADR
jgi:hypothetical protein